MRPPPAVLLALLAAVLVAGCASSPTTCYATPSLGNVSAAAPVAVGAEEHTVVVHVTRPADLNPVPVFGAAVVAAWAIPVDPDVADGAPAALRSLHRGARSETQARFVLVTANLTTDENGDARLHIPATAILQVAATAPGMTTENSGQLGRDRPLPDTVDLVLVPESTSHGFHGSLGQGAAAPSATGTQPVFTQALAWGPQPALWDERLVHVAAVLRWENTPMAQAELDVEVGDPTGQRGSSFGESTPVGAIGDLGPQERGADLDAQERGGLHATSVWVYDGTSARIEDLPFDVEVEGRFAGNGPMDEVCVPSQVTVHGPMDIQAYESAPSPEDRFRALDHPVLMAALTFTVIGLIAVVVVALVRRP